MKIAIDALFAIPTKNEGTVTYLRNLLEKLAEIDRKNEYLVFVSKDNLGVFTLGGSNVKEIKCPIRASFRPLRIIWEQFILPIQIMKLKPDFVFSPSYTAPIFCPVPTVVAIHDTYHFRYPRNLPFMERFIWQTLNRLSARKAKIIITPSQSSKKDILDIFKLAEEKVRVIYDAAAECFHSNYSKEEIGKAKQKYGLGEYYILSVAIMRSNKNIQRLIDAFVILKDRYQIPHRLALVGKAGSMFNIHHRDDIIFTGYIPQNELPLLYCGASILAYPSFFEGFGLPVIEAMACGLPVVASNVTAIPEIMGGAGVLFNPFDIEDIAQAMYRVLSSEELRKELSQKGLARAKEFSWGETAKETLAAFEELLR